MALWGIATSFTSGIFKKPQTQDGFGKYCYTFGDPGSQHYKPPNQLDPRMVKFMNRQPMTAREKASTTKMVLHHARNWTKAQKKSLQEACQNIRVIAEPKPKVVEVHKVSTSYKPQTIEKSRDVQEVVKAGFKPEAKTMIYVGLGISGLLLLSKFLGGSK